MVTQRCICTNVTEGQWLFLQIVFCCAVAIVASVFFMVIAFIIEDCLENRRRARRSRGRQNIREDEQRFEEIH